MVASEARYAQNEADSNVSDKAEWRGRLGRKRRLSIEVCSIQWLPRSGIEEVPFSLSSRYDALELGSPTAGGPRPNSPIVRPACQMQRRAANICGGPTEIWNGADDAAGYVIGGPLRQAGRDPTIWWHGAIGQSCEVDDQEVPSSWSQADGLHLDVFWSVASCFVFGRLQRVWHLVLRDWSSLIISWLSCPPTRGPVYQSNVDLPAKHQPRDSNG